MSSFSTVVVGTGAGEAILVTLEGISGPWHMVQDTAAGSLSKVQRGHLNTLPAVAHDTGFGVIQTEHPASLMVFSKVHAGHSQVDMLVGAVKKKCYRVPFLMIAQPHQTDSDYNQTQLWPKCPPSTSTHIQEDHTHVFRILVRIL